MKIGEAGEAFFIFETSGEVPDELITSPLLEATHSPDIQGQDMQLGRFGARDGKDQDAQSLAQLQQSEPDFLDLDAPPTPPASGQTDSDEKDTVGLLDRATAIGASIGNALLEKERDESLKAREKAKAFYRATQDITQYGTNDPRDVSPSRQSESMPSEPIYNDGVQNPPYNFLSNSDIR
jgi:phosphatidate phosphatase LPIN